MVFVGKVEYKSRIHYCVVGQTSSTGSSNISGLVDNFLVDEPGFTLQELDTLGFHRRYISYDPPEVFAGNFQNGLEVPKSYIRLDDDERDLFERTVKKRLDDRSKQKKANN